MVEHDLAKVGVASSSLVSRSNHLQMTSCCGNSSVGRARPCQGRGREFESRFPLQSLFEPFEFNLSPKYTNPVSQYHHCRVLLVEHDPRLPRLGSRVRVSFPAPISLRSSHHPFELPITSRRDDLLYLAFSQIGSMSSVLASYAGAGEDCGYRQAYDCCGEGCCCCGQAYEHGGEGETAGKKIGGPMAPPTGSLAWLRAG